MDLAQAYGHLKRLGPEDRAWVLAQLSSAAKLKLARGLGADGLLYEATATAKAMRSLDARSAAVVLEALRGESSWVIYAVWRAAEWSWRGAVLRALPPAVRVDILTLEREGYTVPEPVTQFLVRALAERIADVSDAARKTSPLSRLLGRGRRRQ